MQKHNRLLRNIQYIACCVLLLFSVGCILIHPPSSMLTPSARIKSAFGIPIYHTSDLSKIEELIGNRIPIGSNEEAIFSILDRSGFLTDSRNSLLREDTDSGELIVASFSGPSIFEIGFEKHLVVFMMDNKKRLSRIMVLDGNDM